VVKRTLWDYDNIIILCGQGFSKKELSHVIKDPNFLQDMLNKRYDLDIPRQFSHLSDVQASQLFYKASLAKGNIITIYADEPFINRKFVKYIKATYLDKDLKEQTNPKTFTGIKALSSLAYAISEKKKGKKVQVCWKLHKNNEKIQLEEGCAKFISFTAFHKNHVDVNYIKEPSVNIDCDLQLEFLETPEKTNNNTSIIPFFKYIPSFTEYPYIPPPVHDLITYLKLEQKKKVLLVTFGGPEQNIFLLYFINYLREKIENDYRLIFDLANAWDFNYLYSQTDKTTKRGENTTIAFNSEGFINAKIKKNTVENEEDLTGKKAALYFMLNLEPDVPNAPHVDLLSIVGLSAYSTKLCTAYIVAKSLKGKFVLDVPGAYSINFEKYLDDVDDVNKNLPFDDPVVIFDKLKDKLHKIPSKTIATGEFH
jgi:hypothetical protein